MTAVDGLLVAIGGEGPNGVVDAVDVYDPETNGWLPRSAKPLPVANVQAAVIDGMIYAPGGTTATGEVSNALEVYDPVKDAWSSRSSLPAPRAGYGLAAYDGKLYLFGGWNGTAYVDTVLVYDPAADTWETRSPLPNQRRIWCRGSTGRAHSGGGRLRRHQRTGRVQPLPARTATVGRPARR